MTTGPGQHRQQPPTTLNPGDQAPPGTPGTGENICPKCNGSGRRGEAPCEYCASTGRITEGVGGA